MSKMYIPYRFYTVGDSEKNWKEAIGLSACKLVRENNQVKVVGDFHTLIKPVEHFPNKKDLLLTDSSYSELVKSPDYFNAITDFIRWADYNSIFVSWSDEDMQTIELNNKMNGIYDFPKIKNMKLQEEYTRAAHLLHPPGLSEIIRTSGNTCCLEHKCETMNFIENMVTVCKMLWAKPITIEENSCILDGNFKEVILETNAEPTRNKQREEGEALRFLRAEREQRLAGAFF